jgi:hypothetical protein
MKIVRCNICHAGAIKNEESKLEEITDGSLGSDHGILGLQS